jgi:hypothetical protein
VNDLEKQEWDELGLDYGSHERMELDSDVLYPSWVDLRVEKILEESMNPKSY